jgi:hypothetical protein
VTRVLTQRDEASAIGRILTLKSVDLFSLSTEESLADVAAILEEAEVLSGEVLCAGRSRASERTRPSGKQRFHYKAVPV